MLIIVNPYATTVSDRLKNLVVYALRGRYEVDAVDTEATQPRHRAVPGGGEGGLRRRRRVRRRRNRQRGGQRAGRLRGPAHLPARRPDERPVPDARDPDRCGRRHRAPAADGRRLGTRASSTSAGLDERAFMFSAGVGLDASVVERVDAHPRLKARLGEWYYTADRGGDLQPPLPDPAARGWRPTLGGETIRGVTDDRPERLARTRTSATARSRWARAPPWTAAISPGWC